MKFGKVDHPEQIDFTLPQDHPGTKSTLNKSKKGPLKLYVGCAKWNRADLKGFYPRGTKDELEYYSSQFNSIEFNASFYRIFPPEQFKKWTQQDFRVRKSHKKASYNTEGSPQIQNEVVLAHEKCG